MPPEWVLTLDMAAEWGMAPWEVEEAPALWVDRWLALCSQRNARERKSSPGGGHVMEIA